MKYIKKMSCASMSAFNKTSLLTQSKELHDTAIEIKGTLERRTFLNLYCGISVLTLIPDLMIVCN